MEFFLILFSLSLVKVISISVFSVHVVSLASLVSVIFSHRNNDLKQELEAPLCYFMENQC